MTCYAHRHMTIQEYGFWTHAREVSHASGIFYFSGPAVAKHFTDTGKGSVYRVAKSLVQNGWFLKLKESKRDKKTGIYKPGEYQPISHDEWAKKHSGQCVADSEAAVPNIGNGESASIPDYETYRSGNRNAPFRKMKHTVPENGNKSDKENVIKKTGIGEPDSDQAPADMRFDLPETERAYVQEFYGMTANELDEYLAEVPEEERERCLTDLSWDKYFLDKYAKYRAAAEALGLNERLARYTPRARPLEWDSELFEADTSHALDVLEEKTTWRGGRYFFDYNLVTYLEESFGIGTSADLMEDVLACYPEGKRIIMWHKHAVELAEKTIGTAGQTEDDVKERLKQLWSLVSESRKWIRPELESPSPAKPEPDVVQN